MRGKSEGDNIVQNSPICAVSFKVKNDWLFTSANLLDMRKRRPNFFAKPIYINNLLGTHGQENNKKIWVSIPHIQEIGRSKEPIIFYFEGDGTNGGILHDVITFGFPPHMALLYNLREEDGGLPVPMDDIRQLVSAVTDGKVFPAYGYPVKPISTDRIYAFYLLGKDNLVNITNEARNKLEQLKSEVKP